MNIFKYGTRPGIALGLDETFDIGRDTGTSVNEDYSVPFPFTGSMKKLAMKRDR